MIAVDTNLLVYAHREDSPWHEKALGCITQLAEGSSPWCIPWPCIHEFLAIVTSPRIYRPPTPCKAAILQIEAWLESPNLVLLSEMGDYWSELKEIIETGSILGPMVHDARVAAICKSNGVDELWTADRDFGRFPSIKIRNPLV